MTFPKKLRIGYMVYDLEFSPDLYKQRQIISTTEYDHIVIQSTVPIELQIIHIMIQLCFSIFNNAGLGEKYKDAVITSFAKLLTAIIRDNPCLIGEIKELPKTIKIFGMNWKCLADLDDVDNCIGTAKFDNLTLHINVKYRKYNVKSIIIHELIHIIFENLGIQEIEEEVIVLNFIFNTILAQNKFDWILENSMDRV